MVFHPKQPTFLVAPLDDPESDGLEVAVAELKAVFFAARSFDGDPAHDESKDLYQTRPAGTRKVTVQFHRWRGAGGPHAEAPHRHRAGLFFTPFDPRSNNLRVFAVFAALSGVQRLL